MRGSQEDRKVEIVKHNAEPSPPDSQKAASCTGGIQANVQRCFLRDARRPDFYPPVLQQEGCHGARKLQHLMEAGLPSSYYISLVEVRRAPCDGIFSRAVQLYGRESFSSTIVTQCGSCSISWKLGFPIRIILLLSRCVLQPVME